MNKLTKVGLSALCGSLASITAANAGTMEVLGGATVTYTSTSKGVTGNPIGMNSGVTFKGSGELDNGTAFTLTITGADQDAYSAGSISIDTPSMGQFVISSATGGTGLGGYDDKMPTAWEETWGHGMGTGIDLPKGVSSSMNVQYKTPTVAGITLKAAVAPGANNGTLANDKAATGSGSSYKGTGYDLAAEINPSFGTDVLSGLNIFVAGSESDRSLEHSLSAGNTGDHQEAVAGFTYAYGPVKLGYQRSLEMTGAETSGAVDYYQNNAFGISFNISDDLSISYGEMESKKALKNSVANKHVIMEAESIQIAYTMGGLSLKMAESEVTNASYATSASNDKEGRTIALSLAF